MFKCLSLSTETVHVPPDLTGGRRHLRGDALLADTWKSPQNNTNNSHLTEMTQDHIHPWMNNAWYRYLYNTIEEKECYVCSHMPSTSVYPTIYGRMMDSHWQSECAASLEALEDNTLQLA